MLYGKKESNAQRKENLLNLSPYFFARGRKSWLLQNSGPEVNAMFNILEDFIRMAAKVQAVRKMSERDDGE